MGLSLRQIEAMEAATGVTPASRARPRKRRRRNSSMSTEAGRMLTKTAPASRVARYTPPKTATPKATAPQATHGRAGTGRPPPKPKAPAKGFEVIARRTRERTLAGLGGHSSVGEYRAYQDARRRAASRKLASQLKREYVASGTGLTAGQRALTQNERLMETVRRADPATTALERSFDVLNRPTYVLGGQIAHFPEDPRTSFKRVQSELFSGIGGFQGEKTMPSEGLDKHGLLLPGKWGTAQGLIVDVGPSLLAPGVGTVGASRGVLAATKVSKAARLTRTGSRATAEARLPGNVSHPIRARRARRPGPERAKQTARLQPGRGPDVPVRAQTTPRQRRVEDMPYLPVGRQTPRARPAASQQRAARVQRGRALRGVSRPVDDTVLGSAQQGASLIGREVRYSVKGRSHQGVIEAVRTTRAGRPVAMIRDRGGIARAVPAHRIEGVADKGKVAAAERLLTRKAGLADTRARLPGAPYSSFRQGMKVGRAEGGLRQAEDAAVTGINTANKAAAGRPQVRPVVTARGVTWQMPVNASAGARLPGAGRAAPARVRGVPSSSPRRELPYPSAKGGAVAQLERELGAQQDFARKATGVKKRAAIIRIGRLRERLQVARRAERAEVTTSRRGYQAKMRTPRGASPSKGTRRQHRLAGPAKPVRVTRAQLRATRTENLPAGAAGVKAARERLHEAVSTATAKGATARRPTGKQSATVGAKLDRASRALRDFERRVYEQAAKRTERVAKARGGKSATEITDEAKMPAKYADTFTGSAARELIDGHMAVEAAYQAAKAESPMGIRLFLPYTEGGRIGVDIPLVPARFAKSIRGKVPPEVAKALNAFHHMFVTQYGPDKVAGAGARQASAYVAFRNARAYEEVERMTRGFTERELIQATHYIEGVEKKVSPRVAELATRLQRMQEDALDELLQAGYAMKRLGVSPEKIEEEVASTLQQQYIYHLLPASEWQKALANPQIGQLVSYTKAGFSKKRQVATIEELKTVHGLHPVERADQLVFARLAAHNRALAEIELLKSVATRQGRRKADLVDSRGVLRPEYRDWMPLPSQMVGRDVLVPKAVYETLVNAKQIHLKAAQRGTIARGSALANSYWKQMALATTGYDIRNQVGDMMLLFQGTQNPLAPLTALLRGIQAATGKGRVGGRPIKEVKGLAEAQGVTRTSVLAADVRAHQSEVGQYLTKSIRANPRSARTLPQRATRGLARGLQKARAGRENLNRVGHYSQLAKRVGPIEAARRTKARLIDYSDVGSIVQGLRVSPLGAPFVTWMVKNAGIQFRSAVQRPGTLAALAAAYESGYRSSGKPLRHLQQDWQRTALQLPIAGKWITPGLPQADINRLVPAQGPAKFARQQFAQLGPLTQAAPTLIFGIDPLTGEKMSETSPATAGELAFQRTPLGRKVLGGENYVRRRDDEGNFVAAPAIASWGRKALRLAVPPTGPYSKLGASPDPTKSTLEELSSPVLGYRADRMEATKGQLISRIKGDKYELSQMKADVKRELKAWALAGKWKSGDPYPPPVAKKLEAMARKAGEIKRDAELYEQLKAGG